MEQIIKVGDEVLVFGRYEGMVASITGNAILIYCPAYNVVEPWLTTDISNVRILVCQNTLIN